MGKQQLQLLTEICIGHGLHWASSDQGAACHSDAALAGA